MKTVPLHIGSLKKINDFSKVYISRITISNDAGLNTQKEARSVIFQKEAFDDVSLSKNIKVHLNMVCYMTYEQILQNIKFPNGRIRVVANTNSSFYEQISTNPARWLSSGGTMYSRQRTDLSVIDIQYTQFFNKKSFSRSSQLNELNSKESNKNGMVEGQNFTKINLSNGAQLYEVPLEASFVLEQSEISHLSFFVFPMHGLNISSAPPTIATRKLSMGPVTSEIVYSNGQKITDTYAFETLTGEYWTGPIHEHSRENPAPDGYTGWMANTAEHMSAGVRSPKLNKIVFENNKVCDKRMSDKIKSISYEIHKKNKILPKFRKKIDDETRNIGNEIQIERKKRKTSDINFSIDSQNNVRFIFHLNMNEILKEVSEYPALIDSFKAKKPSLYSKMMEPSIIDKITVYRQLVGQETDLKRDTSRANNPKNSPEEIIFQSSGGELQAGTIPFFGVFDNISRKNVGANQSPISSLSRVNLNIPLSQEIFTYTGVDFQVGTRQSGKYKYSLELSLQDPTKDYLNSVIGELEAILEGGTTRQSLRKYYDDATSDGRYYSSKTQSFTNRFISFYKENYYSQEKDYIEEMVKSFVSVISLLNTGSTYKMPSPSSAMQSDEIYDIYKYLINISSPYSGTTEGILELISLIEETKNKIIKERNLSYSTQKARDGKKELLSSPNTSSTGRSTYTSHRSEFKNTLNMDNTSDRKFYEFLMINKRDSETNQDGLMLVNRSYFIERANMESSKLFGRDEGPIVVKDINENVYNPADSVENNKFSFLSPSRVVLGENRTLEMFSNAGSPAFNDDLDEINSALNEIITHNQANSLLKGMQQMADSGMSFRYKKERDYSSQSREENNPTIFNKSNASTLYEDTPDEFVPRERANSEPESKDGSELVKFINRASNSNFLDSSNTVKFYNVNMKGGGEAFKKQRSSGAAQRSLTGAPNHLKSLIINISSPQENARNPYGGEQFVEKDFLRDPKQQGFIYLNYKRLIKVEVLRGFKRDSGSQSLNSPIWTTIRQQDLNSTKDSVLYCRMVNYEDADYGYSEDKSLSLPIRNQYFFIHTGKQQAERISSYDPYSDENKNLDLYQYDRTLQKLMLDYEQKRRRVFSRGSACAKISFFETNIACKISQPVYFNRGRVPQLSDGVFFAGKSHTDIREYLIMSGYADVVGYSQTGMSTSRPVNARGLQRTDPVAGTSMPQSNMSAARAGNMQTRSRTAPSPRASSRTGTMGSTGGGSGGSGGTY